MWEAVDYILHHNYEWALAEEEPASLGSIIEFMTDPNPNYMTLIFGGATLNSAYSGSTIGLGHITLLSPIMYWLFEYPPTIADLDFWPSHRVQEPARNQQLLFLPQTRIPLWTTEIQWWANATREVVSVTAVPPIIRLPPPTDMEVNVDFITGQTENWRRTRNAPQEPQSETAHGMPLPRLGRIIDASHVFSRAYREVIFQNQERVVLYTSNSAEGISLYWDNYWIHYRQYRRDFWHFTSAFAVPNHFSLWREIDPTGD